MSFFYVFHSVVMLKTIYYVFRHTQLALSVIRQVVYDGKRNK
jgi:hypothetical protein